MPQLLFTSAPLAALANILSKTYLNGVTGVFAPAERTADITKAISAAGNKIYLCKPGQPLPDHVRHIAAAGGEDIVQVAKAAAKGRALTLIPDAPYRACFTENSHFGMRISKDRVPENVILDENPVENYRAQITLSLFSLLTDVIDVLAVGGAKEGDLFWVRQAVLEEILNPSIPGEATSLLKEGQETLQKSGRQGGAEAAIYMGRARQKGESAYLYDFFTCYMINLLLLQFTKHKINGILMGADRVRTRTVLRCLGEYSLRKSPVSPLPCRETAVLSAEELHAVARALAQYSDGCDNRRIGVAFVLDNIRIASERGGSRGLLFNLADSGWIDGLNLQ